MKHHDTRTRQLAGTITRLHRLGCACGYAFGLLTAWPAQAASILWMGGEEIDFMNVGTPVLSTTAAHFRSNYARGGLSPTTASTAIYSDAFPGGAVTSAWLSARVYVDGATGSAATVSRAVGLVNATTRNGVWVGWTGGSSLYQIAIYKSDGTQLTNAISAAAVLSNATLVKFDLEVKDYGSTSGVVNVYLNGGSTPIASFTGNVAVSGTTNLNSVGIGYYSYRPRVSEVVVGDSQTDTRNASLVTLAPSGAGDDTSWTGICSNLSETAVTDSTVAQTATSGKNFQCALADVQATGSFLVAALRLSARANKTNSGTRQLSLGVKTNAFVNTAQAITPVAATSWGQTQALFPINPITATGWTISDLNALQLNLQSSEPQPGVFITTKNYLNTEGLE